MAYLAVWLEGNGGNWYACIIDQDQVFKHLSHPCQIVGKAIHVAMMEIYFQ